MAQEQGAGVGGAPSIFDLVRRYNPQLVPSLNRGRIQAEAQFVPPVYNIYDAVRSVYPNLSAQAQAWLPTVPIKIDPSMGYGSASYSPTTGRINISSPDPYLAGHELTHAWLEKQTGGNVLKQMFPGGLPYQWQAWTDPRTRYYLDAYRNEAVDKTAALRSVFVNPTEAVAEAVQRLGPAITYTQSQPILKALNGMFDPYRATGIPATNVLSNPNARGRF